MNEDPGKHLGGTWTTMEWHSGGGVRTVSLKPGYAFCGTFTVMAFCPGGGDAAVFILVMRDMVTNNSSTTYQSSICVERCIHRLDPRPARLEQA
jgi:hypothetical protein